MLTLDENDKGMQISNLKKTRKSPDIKQMERVYSINCNMLGEHYATNIWAGDYHLAKDDGSLIEFQQLSERSGGINRLGVLRADVDNLGQALTSGFPEGYRTLSRYAMLSYYLSYFFKYQINMICGRKSGIPCFSLYGEKEDHPAAVVIVYSGGDDVFIVGAWDEVMDIAIDFREAFGLYTQNKLTLSAGIGLFNPSFPIRRMADKAGELEDSAKEVSELWGVSERWI